jgi:hypothetical protein
MREETRESPEPLTQEPPLSSACVHTTTFAQYTDPLEDERVYAAHDGELVKKSSVSIENDAGCYNRYTPT